MSTDKFLSRVHRGAEYNCAHFVCEVWTELRGVDAAKILRGFLCAPSKMYVSISDVRQVEILSAPANQCIALFHNKHQSHVGVLIKDRVLHLPRTGMARYEPLWVVQTGFMKTRYLNV